MQDLCPCLCTVVDGGEGCTSLVVREDQSKNFALFFGYPCAHLQFFPPLYVLSIAYTMETSRLWKRKKYLANLKNQPCNIFGFGVHFFRLSACLQEYSELQQRGFPFKLSAVCIPEMNCPDTSTCSLRRVRYLKLFLISNR